LAGRKPVTEILANKNKLDEMVSEAPVDASDIADYEEPPFLK
jgi:hypothetical protein